MNGTIGGKVLCVCETSDAYTIRGARIKLFNVYLRPNWSKRPIRLADSKRVRCKFTRDKFDVKQPYIQSYALYFNTDGNSLIIDNWYDFAYAFYEVNE